MKSDNLLAVPYHSQFIEIQDPFWNIRSCSGTCAAMVLEFLLEKKIDILEYMRTAEKEGGYHPINGMYHDYIISSFEKEGLKSWRYKNLETKDTLDSMEKIFESLRSGYPVIVSVNKVILEQTRFHLVLLVGYVEDELGNITHLYYHEPEATLVSKEGDPAVGGANRKVDVETFKKFWRGKAIFVSK
jgi:hypothetical protein